MNEQKRKFIKVIKQRRRRAKYLKQKHYLKYHWKRRLLRRHIKSDKPVTLDNFKLKVLPDGRIVATKLTKLQQLKLKFKKLIKKIYESTRRVLSKTPPGDV